MAKVTKYLNQIFKKLNRKERVYLFPNNLGRYYLGVWFLTLILSIGYGNNLILGFSIFLFILNIWWMFEAHIAMKNLQLSALHFEDGFAGDKTTLIVHWKREPDALTQIQFTFEDEIKEIKSKTEVYQPETSSCEINTSQRGAYHFNFIKIQASGGLNLYSVWKYVYFPVSLWVYPKPIQGKENFEQNLESAQNQNLKTKFDGEEVEDLRPYHPGEDIRGIDWKRWASQSILSKKNRIGPVESVSVIKLRSGMTEEELENASFELLRSKRLNSHWMIDKNGIIDGPFSQAFERKTWWRHLATWT